MRELRTKARGQQFGKQVFLDALALAATDLAAFFFGDLLHLALQFVVHHRGGQQLFLAADGEQRAGVYGVRERCFFTATDGRHETARAHFQWAAGP